MSLRELNRLIGTALVEPRFCERLLNGGREEALAVFELTAEERTLLLGIRADSLRGFAQVLDEWMTCRDGTVPIAGSAVENHLRQWQELESRVL